MSNDQADFEVRLVDKVSGPANKGAEALGRFHDKAGRLREANGRFVQGAERVQAGLFGIKKAGDSVFSGALKADIVMRSAVAMGHFAASVATGAYELVTFGQNSRLAFDQLAKHGASGTKIFDHARRLAAEYGLEVKDTSKQYSKFLALQFSPAQADSLVRTGADLRALGNSAEDVQGIFMAMGQIKSKGRLQAEELLQLQERGVSGGLVKEEIAKLMGVAVSEVDKLQQKGAVSAEIGLDAIQNAINRKLNQSEAGVAGKKFADTTIDGITGKLKARATNLGIDLLGVLEKPFTGAAGAILTKLEAVGKSEAGAKMFTALSSGIESFGRFISFAAPLFIDFVTTVGSGAVDAFGKLSGALNITSGDSGDITQTLMTLASVLGDVLGAAAYGITIFGSLALGVGMLAGVLAGAGRAGIEGFLRPFIEGIGDLMLWWDDLSALWSAEGLSLGEKAWAIGKQLMTGLAQGIWNTLTLPIEAVWGAGKGIVDGAKAALGIHSPSKEMIALGEYTGEGFAIGLERGMPAANDNFGPFASSAQGAVGTVGAVGGGGAGGNVFHAEIHVHMGSGAGGAASGRSIADEIDRALEERFRIWAAELAA